MWHESLSSLFLSCHDASMALSAVSILNTLRNMYDPPRTFLAYRTPLDLLVATILSAQCTDARVNAVTSKALYPKYTTASDYASVSQEELEKDIQSCGTFRNKARFIRGMAALLLQRHGGEVPQTMKELTALPGVGRKTASIILWSCFGKNEGIAVDTHVMRLARRLGLSRAKTPQKIELDLLSALPKEEWGYFTTLIISHARAVCPARKRKCEACVFQKECPSSAVMGREDRSIK